MAKCIANHVANAQTHANTNACACNTAAIFGRFFHAVGHPKLGKLLHVNFIKPAVIKNFFFDIVGHRNVLNQEFGADVGAQPAAEC